MSQPAMQNAAKAATNAVKDSTGSMFKGVTGQMILFYFSAVTAIAFFITSFVYFGKMMGSSDRWNEIQPQVIKIMIFTGIGTIAIMVAALLYFTQDPNKTIYFVLILSCLAIGMSYAAVALAAISR
jgi:hypothetical protein